ncbi:hypothetical protein OEZ85_013479 [Tetradesmus obliquus]|uniref:inositol-pentakisphosphate 2-kinase n=1 Tax=Tetradesmus obliquus TaxID=3088 RepID=A0ABY8UQY0_TETOB|nr:hypothetical protein OEZ85_013479 [Tetradesmus obliquus]
MPVQPPEGKVLRLRKVKAAAILQQQQQQTPGAKGDCTGQQRPQQQQASGSDKGPAAAAAAATAAESAAAAAADAAAAAAAVAALEAEVWQPVIPQWQQLDAMQRELAFVEAVLAPALPGCCRLAIAEAQRVQLPSQLLPVQQQQQPERLPQQLLPAQQQQLPQLPPEQQQQQGSWRVAAGEVALLLPDVTLLDAAAVPAGFRRVGPCVCVEVKPKAGFMPGGGSAVAAGSIKRRLPRFTMHQLLKHLKGKSPDMSRYNPLDLFGTAASHTSNNSGSAHGGSGSSSAGDAPAAAAAAAAAAALPASCGEVLARQQAALAALLECPYNNLKVFVDGSLIYGGKADVAVSTAAAAAARDASATAPTAAAAAAAAAQAEAAPDNERKVEQHRTAVPADMPDAGSSSSSNVRTVKEQIPAKDSRLKGIVRSKAPRPATMIRSSTRLLACQGFLANGTVLGSCRSATEALHNAAGQPANSNPNSSSSNSRSRRPRSSCDALLMRHSPATGSSSSSSSSSGAAWFGAGSIGGGGGGAFVAQGNKIGWLAGPSGASNAAWSCSGSVRSIFGVAAKPAEQQQEAEPSAPAVGETPLDLDIGGEGGYFDHDEAHAGLAEREAIAALFDTWNAALATKDPAAVADLYGHDAVLLPTVSNEVRTTRAGIVDYFSNFLKLSPQGKVDQSTIRLLSPDVALHSGVYSFTLNPAEGETKIVQARFTFLYRKYGNGHWRIAEHHSSAMPEAKPAGVEEMFDKWNEALQTGNPEVVADLYAPDGVLLPTVSNQVRTCRQGIIDYFSNFLKLKPHGTINSSVLREVSPGVAISSGVYTFKLTTPESGETRHVRARYTFIYRQIDGRWFIAEHHSSAMPEA